MPKIQKPTTPTTPTTPPPAPPVEPEGTNALVASYEVTETPPEPGATPAKAAHIQPAKARVASSVIPRDPVDDYPTPDGFTQALLDYLDLDTSATVLEPSAGSGHLVQSLRKAGFENVEFRDLVFGGQDFMEGEPPAEPTHDWVITNPPYKLAEPFVYRSLAHARIGVAFLLNSGFLESVGRAQGLFRDFPPAYILLNSRKMKLNGERDGRSSIFAHVWVVWAPLLYWANGGHTVFDWVRPEGELKIPSHNAGVWDE